jgi:hypothetical protein
MEKKGEGKIIQSTNHIMTQKDMIVMYWLGGRIHINNFLAVSIPVIYNAIILDEPCH